jgi:hypothetical protein
LDDQKEGEGCGKLSLQQKFAQYFIGNDGIWNDYFYWFDVARVWQKLTVQDTTQDI